MLRLRKTILTLLLAIATSQAQVGIGPGTYLANGDYFVCVPPGFCANGGGPVGIDPRIVTPGQAPAPGTCSTGLVPCYVQGPSSRCGQILVNPPPSTATGPTVIAAHPWQAYIRNATEAVYAGSGVLIDNYHVVTAAHKVALSPTNIDSVGTVTVYMGVVNPTAPGTPTAQTRTPGRITVHPMFDPATLKNDIAVIRVSQAFNLSQPDINILCLPAVGSAAVYTANLSCNVAGWGESAFRLNDKPTNPMKQVNVTTHDANTCIQGLLPVLPTVNNYFDPANELCAGGLPMQDACTFDGGAPLVCPNAGRNYAAGLVIWGKGCGQAGVSGVYVSVAAYRTWIDQQITAP